MPNRLQRSARTAQRDKYKIIILYLMKNLPKIYPKEIIEKITNLKTGEEYKDDNEWKSKGIPESEIRKDVTVVMPKLDIFPKTK